MDDKKNVTITFSMFAPHLDYRHVILTAQHHESLVYPVKVDADVLRKRSMFDAMATTTMLFGEAQPKPKGEASSDVELIKIVGIVLHSDSVVSAALSLIAKSTDVLEGKVNFSKQEPSAIAGPGTDKCDDPSK